MNLLSTASEVISILTFVGSFAGYLFGLRIRNEIAENNEKIQKQIAELRNDLADADKVLSIVNGKYVRTDLFNQAMTGMKEILEVNMHRLEQLLDQQIEAIKDRLQHR